MGEVFIYEVYGCYRLKILFVEIAELIRKTRNIFEFI